MLWRWKLFDTFSGLFTDPFLSGIIGAFLHIRCIPHQNSQRLFWASVCDTFTICEFLVPHRAIWLYMYLHCSMCQVTLEGIRWGLRLKTQSHTPKCTERPWKALKGLATSQGPFVSRLRVFQSVRALALTHEAIANSIASMPCTLFGFQVLGCSGHLLNMYLHYLCWPGWLSASLVSPGMEVSLSLSRPKLRSRHQI